MANYKNIKNEYDIIWDSTIQSTNFTAESTQGYFIDTSSAIVTMTLPASPGAGDFVAVKDYARSFGTNKLVIAGNGSNIQGSADDSALDQTGDTAVLVYIDSTKGWLYTQENTVTPVSNAEFVAATGGTITTSGDYKIHTFTSSGTFTVTSAGNAAGSDSVDYFVVAGGGGGGGGQEDDSAGGGGGGGFRLSNSTNMPAPTTSPLASPAGIPVSAQGYPITVGGGGAGSPGIGNGNTGSKGSDSVFSTITSTGGGYGGGANVANGGPGGSGGAAGGGGAGAGPGSGNSPSVSPPQGNDGGNSVTTFGGGGGGAGAAGQGGGPFPVTSPTQAYGGIGSYVTSTGFAGSNGTPGPVGSAKYFSGGGGGSNVPGRSPSGTSAPGGSGGGGNGNPPTAGTTNTGGGGGGGTRAVGQAGGSGIVIIRYKFQ